MNVPFYQVDAFTSRAFGGNPAAVILLEEWPEDVVLQAIAEENNLSETAFLVELDKEEPAYFIRWFTPVDEVDLCGHATLASAHVLFNEVGLKTNKIRLETKEAGSLFVSRNNGQIVMDFPLVPIRLIAMEDQSISHQQAAEATSLILELESEQAVADFVPDQSIIRRLHAHSVAITAKAEGKSYDFVSRFFAPHYGIPEDPVTGSLHCALADYWQKRLNQTQFKAVQLSKRRGELTLEVRGNRVLLKGSCQTIIRGAFMW